MVTAVGDCRASTLWSMEDDRPATAAGTGGAAVHATGVRLGYRGESVLRIESLALRFAEVTALIGPNGSGKSTLLNGIGGLVPPLGGTLEVLGLEPAAARRRVAYVLQATEANRTLPVTAREVVAMARFAARGLLHPLRAADRAAVTHAMERLDVAHLADRHLRDLSGGERQRILVAQGLAQEADVLLLDEPVTGLDAVSQARILGVVAEERAAGRAVVVATHDLREAQRADHVVLLAGRVVASGPPAFVLTPAALQEAYGGRLVPVGVGTAIDDDHGHPHAGDLPHRPPRG